MAKQLGYACINTSLRKQKVYTNRSMIRKTFDKKGLPYVSELALQNVTDLKSIIQWNIDHGIMVYRMSSGMFPWMSEYEFTDLPDYDLISSTLREAGDLAQSNGQRLSFHPGQFCVLSSPNEDVVNRSIDELDKHSQIMDMMGLPTSNMAKINIHIGGAYGDKTSALQRFCDNFKRLHPNTQSRLTVENDDKASMYSVVDLYEGVYKVVGIPIVFDYYHHKFCTGDLTEQQALELAISTWDCKPCTHYSECRRDEQKLIIEDICRTNNISMDELPSWPTLSSIYRDFQKTKQQAHSDYIVNYIDDYGHDIDVVVEAKAKEVAVSRYLKKYSNKSELNFI